MTKASIARLRRNNDLLRALKTAKPSRRRELIRNADTDLVATVCECCKNVLVGNVPLSASQKRSLGKYKKVMRTLAGHNISLASKKKLFRKQKGGFVASLIPALLGPVLGAITNLVAK